MARGPDPQLGLFGGASAAAPRLGRRIPAVPVSAEIGALAARLPPSLRLGASSWSYEGWSGIVFQGRVKAAELARDGLRPYASHPLFRTVSLDRTHHGPIDREVFRSYAEQLPEDFRMLVKAHDHCVLSRFPNHPKYGAQAGLMNERFLDPNYAIESTVAPAMDGLGNRLGAILFQFAWQSLSDLHADGGFHLRLGHFLEALPKGPLYAVEVRNSELLSPELGRVLDGNGVCPVISACAKMPSIDEQIRRLPVWAAPAVIGRWLLPDGGGHEETGEQFAPFNRLVRQDRRLRGDFARLATDAIAKGKPALITVSNTAEGCAPHSLVLLASEIDAMLGRPTL